MAVTHQKVIHGQTMEAMNANLTTAIYEGWQPLGQVFYAPAASGSSAGGFYCTVIKGKLEGSLNELIDQIDNISEAVSQLDSRVTALEGGGGGDT